MRPRYQLVGAFEKRKSLWPSTLFYREPDFRATQPRVIHTMSYVDPNCRASV